MLHLSGLQQTDLFSLDVEGSEAHVLATMDWSIPVQVFIVEVSHLTSTDKALVHTLMQAHGYYKCAWASPATPHALANQLFVGKSMHAKGYCAR